MKRPIDLIIALVLAAWMPFCCCQVRTAAGALVVEMAGEGAQPVRGGSCCQPVVAGDMQEGATRCADTAGDDAASGHTTPDNTAPDNTAPGNTPAPNKCATCKDRTLPSELTLPAPDTIGAVLMLAACDRAATLDAGTASPTGPEARPRAGPPAHPAGRRLLAHTGTLLI